MRVKEGGRCFQSSKRGNVGLDAIMVIVVLFVIAIASIAGYKVILDVNNDTQADPDINNKSKAAMDQVTTDYPTIMDNGFAFFFALIWVLAVIASFFVDAHPVFLILAIVVIVILIFIASSVDNIYAEMIDDPLLATEAAAFPKTNWIMDHLVFVILAIAISIGISLYAKQQWL